MHLDHLFFTEIPAVFERNVFSRKSGYFNTFSACNSLTALFLSHPQQSLDLQSRMMIPSFLQNIFQRKTLTFSFFFTMASVLQTNTGSTKGL